MELVKESDEQFLAAWGYFARAMGNPLLEAREGVSAVCGQVPFPFFNFVFLLEEPADRRALERAIGSGLEIGNGLGLPWMFCVGHHAVPGDKFSEAVELLGEAGMAAAMELTGMVADDLAPASRDAAGELELVRVSGDPERRAVSDINCTAYGIPLEAGHGIMDREAIFVAPGNAVVGRVGGDAVACSATFPVDGRLYVACVATMPERQRRGYAEAAMRRSLELAAAETGLRRTVLHATNAGRPVYERMGYEAVAGYTVFAAEH